MTLAELKLIHNRVIHIEGVNCSESDLLLEEIWIKKYPYDVLNNVCSECFSDPD